MPVAMTTVEQAAVLLDFNQKLDINLLDNVVTCFYSSEGPEVFHCVFCYRLSKRFPNALRLNSKTIPYSVKCLFFFSKRQQIKS